MAHRNATPEMNTGMLLCRCRSRCFLEDQAMVIMTTDTGTYSAQEMSASLVVCHVCRPPQPLTRTAAALWQQVSTQPHLCICAAPVSQLHVGAHRQPQRSHMHSANLVTRPGHFCMASGDEAASKLGGQARSKAHQLRVGLVRGVGGLGVGAAKVARDHGVQQQRRPEEHAAERARSARGGWAEAVATWPWHP